MPANMAYTAQKMRKLTFLVEYQAMWDQCEGLLILVSLHHAGLIGQDL
jgi:hypothetical protein